jgi:CDGSH-type Zn-finger protein
LESNRSGDAGQNQVRQKPKILLLTNGPYYLINDIEPKTIENLQNSKGELLSTISGAALCRCGASKNKPFCDGTHGVIGFSSENRKARVTPADNRKMNIKDKRNTYVGKKITIHDNRRICSHAAECVNNSPSVFKLNSRPWCTIKRNNRFDKKMSFRCTQLFH